MTEKEQLARDLQEFRRFMDVLSQGAREKAGNRILAFYVDAKRGEAGE